jgi:hypothetical protein
MQGAQSSEFVYGNSDSGARPLERCRRMPKTNHEDQKTSKNQELRGLWLRRRRFRSCAAESTPGTGIGDKCMGIGCDREAHISPHAPGLRIASSARLSPMPVPGVAAKAYFRRTTHRNPM